MKTIFNDVWFLFMTKLGNEVDQTKNYGMNLRKNQTNIFIKSITLVRIKFSIKIRKDLNMFEVSGRKVEKQDDQSNQKYCFMLLIKYLNAYQSK